MATLASIARLAAEQRAAGNCGLHYAGGGSAATSPVAPFRRRSAAPNQRAWPRGAVRTRGRRSVTRNSTRRTTFFRPPANRARLDAEEWI